MSRRKDWPTAGFPNASNADSTIRDCDAPSWVIVSGLAVSPNDNAISDGPVRGGTSVEFTTHAAEARASPTPSVASFASGLAIALEVPKVSEIDLNRSSDGDRIPHAVLPEECDLADGVDDRDVVRQVRQRRFEFRGMPDELERERQRAANLNGAGRGAIPRIRHVDAGCVAPVSAPVVHVIPGDRYFVVRRRRGRSHGRPDVFRYYPKDDLPVVVEHRRAGAGHRAWRRRSLLRQDVRLQRIAEGLAAGSAARSLEGIDHYEHWALAVADDISARDGRGRRAQKSNRLDKAFEIAHGCHLSYALMIRGVMKISSSVLWSSMRSRLNSQLINGIWLRPGVRSLAFCWLLV